MDAVLAKFERVDDFQRKNFLGHLALFNNGTKERFLEEVKDYRIRQARASRQAGGVASSDRVPGNIVSQMNTAAGQHDGREAPQGSLEHDIWTRGEGEAVRQGSSPVIVPADEAPRADSDAVQRCVPREAGCGAQASAVEDGRRVNIEGQGHGQARATEGRADSHGADTQVDAPGSCRSQSADGEQEGSRRQDHSGDAKRGAAAAEEGGKEAEAGADVEMREADAPGGTGTGSPPFLAQPALPVRTGLPPGTKVIEAALPVGLSVQKGRLDAGNEAASGESGEAQPDERPGESAGASLDGASHLSVSHLSVSRQSVSDSHTRGASDNGTMAPKSAACTDKDEVEEAHAQDGTAQGGGSGLQDASQGSGGGGGGELKPDAVAGDGATQATDKAAPGAKQGPRAGQMLVVEARRKQHTRMIERYRELEVRP